MTIASFISALFERNAFTSLLKGTFMANAREDGDGMKLRMKAALALLVIYAAMHLAVGGLLRILNPSDVTPANVPVAATATMEAAYRPDIDAPSATDAPREKTRRPGESRECRIGFPFDSDCLFD
jgi:hypothetical protein